MRRSAAGADYQDGRGNVCEGVDASFGSVCFNANVVANGAFGNVAMGASMRTRSPAAATTSPRLLKEELKHDRGGVNLAAAAVRWRRTRPARITLPAALMRCNTT